MEVMGVGGGENQTAREVLLGEPPSSRNPAQFGKERRRGSVDGKNAKKIGHYGVCISEISINWGLPDTPH